MIVARLETMADDKEDDNGLLDDKSLSATFGFHQKVQTAHSFSSSSSDSLSLARMTPGSMASA